MTGVQTCALPIFVLLELVAFGVVVALRGPAQDGGELTDYRGAGLRSPWLGAALVLALAGLAGLPPGLSGLFAKVTIVASLINEGWGWLAGVVALNAVIALAYYIRFAALLYTRPATVGIPFADLSPTAQPAEPAPEVATPADPVPAPSAAAARPAEPAGTTMTAVVDPNLLEAATHPRVEVPRLVAATIAVAAVITIVLGFAPQWIFDALIG